MKRSYLRFLQKDRCLVSVSGMTLVELIIASSISGIIIGIAMLVLINSIVLYQRGSVRARIENNARLQAEKITRELREAKKIIQITESAAYPLYTKICFTNLEDVEIFYLYDASQKYLVRRQAGTTDRVMARIFQTHDDVVFTGYSQDNETTTDPQQVNSVKINLETTDQKGENTFSMHTLATLRN